MRGRSYPRYGKLSSFDWSELSEDQRVGRIVAVVRLSRNVTQGGLAEMAGRTRDAVAQMERRGVGYTDPWPIRALGLDINKVRALARDGNIKLNGIFDLREQLDKHPVDQAVSHKSRSKAK